MELPTDEAHLWLAATDAGLFSPEVLESCRAYLTIEERAQEHTFLSPHVAHEFVIARALCRTVLSRYAALDPLDWHFTKNKYGRPEIANGPPDCRLHFNISHCDGLVACIVAQDRDIGVDVECISRNISHLEIAKSMFSPREYSALSSLPQSQHLRRFFEYWTLKESYIKARGMGLSLPLDQFSFAIDHREVSISFQGLDDHPGAWQFDLLQPSLRHQAAACIKKGVGAPRLSIVEFHVEPQTTAVPFPLRIIA